VARIGSSVAMRDSKDPESPVLLFTPEQWGAFVAGVHADEFRSN
jgi:hypothetical protein